MLHLSLITLPRRSSRWQFLQPYQLHQILWKGFPNLPRHTTEDRFLYRADEGERAHSILVQSAISPDWSFLHRDGEGATVQVREFDPLQILPGMRYRFFVRANPVVRRVFDMPAAEGEKRRGRHIAVGSDRARVAAMLGVAREDVPTREEQLLAWFERKAGPGGFTVAYAVPGPNHDVVVRSGGDRAPMKFTTVEFEGVLIVKDAALFARALERGIGRGKAFGFGLLSLKRG